MMITEKKKGTLILSARGPSRSRLHRSTLPVTKRSAGGGGEGGGKATFQRATRIHPYGRFLDALTGWKGS